MSDKVKLSRKKVEKILKGLEQSDSLYIDSGHKLDPLNYVYALKELLKSATEKG